MLLPEHLQCFDCVLAVMDMHFSVCSHGRVCAPKVLSPEWPWALKPKPNTNCNPLAMGQEVLPTLRPGPAGLMAPRGCSSWAAPYPLAHAAVYNAIVCLLGRCSPVHWAVIASLASVPWCTGPLLYCWPPCCITQAPP